MLSFEGGERGSPGGRKVDLRSWTGGRGSRFLFYLLALLSLSRSAAAGAYEPEQKLYVASSQESLPSAAPSAGDEDERPDRIAAAASQSPETDSLPVYTPPRRAIPRALVGGGLRLTRGLPAPLALVPAHLGETLSASPSLFWYVSAAPPAGAHATLTIASEDEVEPLLDVKLPVPGRAGIQRVRLADYGVVLQPGVEYEWAIALGLDEESSARDQIANGYITRVAEPAELATRARSAATLASLGLWYDALAAISDEVEARPHDARTREARAALLRQAELKAPLE
jgi:hypothetical protein